MNQIKIGKFIAETRKQQNMTQRQLADVLSISDKTISKWECGKGLPEISLMMPLCETLQITSMTFLQVKEFPRMIIKRKRRRI